MAGTAPSAKKGGRPRLAQPKVQVAFRIPAEVFDIYDQAERTGGMKATKAMEHAVTLQAQAIKRAFRYKKPSEGLNRHTLSHDGGPPVHHR